MLCQVFEATTITLIHFLLLPRRCIALDAFLVFFAQFRWIRDSAMPLGPKWGMVYRNIVKRVWTELRIHRCFFCWCQGTSHKTVRIRIA